MYIDVVNKAIVEKRTNTISNLSQTDDVNLSFSLLSVSASSIMSSIVRFGNDKCPYVIYHDINLSLKKIFT
jgi:hypothetical protein